MFILFDKYRWCLKLISDYPNVKLHFVRSSENLADFLTREGLPQGDCEKLNLKHVTIDNFFAKLPKHDFTLIEWAQYCEDHPEYLTINNPPPVPTITMAITRGIDNVTDITTPVTILKERLSRAELVQKQKQELKDIYTACLGSPDLSIKRSMTQK